MTNTDRFDNIYRKSAGICVFSIGQVIGESVYEDDFRRRFGPLKGAVAVDLDQRFSGGEIGDLGVGGN